MRLADLPAVGLPLLVVLDPLALQPVAHRLVEEHPGRLGLQDGRTGVRVDGRRPAQRQQLVDHLVGVPAQRLERGEAGLGRARRSRAPSSSSWPSGARVTACRWTP